MSVEASKWAWGLRLPPAMKLVLLVLADHANHDGVCWPGIDGVEMKTGLSRRAVIANMNKLIAGNLVSKRARGGSGGGRLSNVYVLHLDQLDLPLEQSADDAQCTGSTVHGEHSADGDRQCASDDRQCAPPAQQSAPPAPESSINHQSTTTQPSGRATRLPDGFELTTERALVAGTEGLDPERTFAKFRDHWLAASGQRARKHDWDATWRNWCRTEADRSRGTGGPPRRPSYTDQLRQTAAAMQAKGVNLDE